MTLRSTFLPALFIPAKVTTLFTLMGEKKEDDEFVLQVG